MPRVADVRPAQYGDLRGLGWKGLGRGVSIDKFAYLALTGDRFEPPGMPADAAIEVRNYREAVYALAREIWLQENDRLRVPNGFPTAFDLRLTSIDPGSALPVLMLHRSEGVADEEFEDWQVIFARARDFLTTTISSVATEEALPPSFPKGALPQIRRMGSSLGNDEVMTVGGPEPGSPRADLTKDVRAMISQIDALIGEDPVEVSVEGVIIEADSMRKSFKLRRKSDEVVIGCDIASFDAQLARVIKESLSLDGIDGPDVHVVGVADGGDEKLYRSLSDVSSVGVIRTIRQKRVLERIQSFLTLDEGWWGGKGRRVNESLVESAEGVVMRIRGPIEGLSVGPTKSGSLVFEWRRASKELTLELEADGRMFMCVDDVDTDELRESHDPFDLDRAATFLGTGDFS